ncbi:hypothetical protein [Weissella paramesenteroides]|uniref:hypothetical protein n=2 Tax=Weissella paramesenteroides TaxID=1249 RepID=UPI00223BC856|nr:hypothetical protein [Weissella paramesenteroides]MCT0484870.1 hypothetical protein [Weissella paramesenteroides]
MPDFWPHDFATWVATGGVLLGGLWGVIKFTFVKSFDQLNDSIKGLQNTIGSVDQRLDDLDKRTLRLEDWREYHSKKDDK